MPTAARVRRIVFSLCVPPFAVSTGAAQEPGTRLRWTEGRLLPGDRSAEASLSPRAAEPPDVRLLAFTVGLSWHPTPAVRLRADVVRERLVSAVPGSHGVEPRALHAMSFLAP